MEEPGLRTCVVLQPGYLPWLGFFEQVSRADEFVFLDDVQFDKHGWRNRNRVKGPDGPQWLTVPVRVSGRNRPPIRDVEIDRTQRRWAGKHLQSLRSNYGPCPFFEWLFPDLERTLHLPWSRICELNHALTELLCGKLGLRSTFRHSTALNVGGDRCERLIRICQAVGCNHYYSGTAARDYLDIAGFERAGITVEFQDYAHPEYPQRYGAFVSHLSVIDLLFNCGPRSADILSRGSAARAANPQAGA